LWYVGIFRREAGARKDFAFRERTNQLMPAENMSKTPNAALRPVGIFILLLLALGVRLIFWHSQIAVIESEGSGYARMADNLVSGRGFYGTHPEIDVMDTWLYPTLIAGLTFIIHNSETAARLISLVTGVALILPVFFIAFRLYGRTVAWIAALLIASHPLLVALSPSGYTEAPQLFLMMGSVWFVLRCFDGADRYAWFWAGVFFGLAYLNRPESLLLLPYSLVAILLVRAFRGENVWRSAKICTGILLVFVVLAAPYVALLWHYTGHFRLEGKSKINYTIGRRLVAGMSPKEAESGIDQDLNEVGPLMSQFKFASYSPYPVRMADILRYYFHIAKINKNWIYQRILPSYAFGAPITTFLVILGLFRTPWTKDRAILEIFFLGIVCYVLALLLGIQSQQLRYAFPLIPFVAMWASKGIVELAGWSEESLSAWQASSSITRVLPGAIAVLAFLLILVFAARGVQDVTPLEGGRPRHLPLRQAGLWLKEQKPRLMFGNTVVSYYANTDTLLFPFTSGSTALRYIERKNPDFLELDYNITGSSYEEEWLTNGIPDPRAQLVYQTQNPDSGRVVIYRWQASTK
jgi:4-amino-4-deoxy-L-arabinose transferase-like glycosyltransferase